MRTMSHHIRLIGKAFLSAVSSFLDGETQDSPQFAQVAIFPSLLLLLHRDGDADHSGSCSSGTRLLILSFAEEHSEYIIYRSFSKRQRIPEAFFQ